MINTHVTVSSSASPAPVAGAGSAARHGKTKGEPKADGFSALLDSLAHPAAQSRPAAQKGAPQAQTARPASPPESPATVERRPKEEEASQAQPPEAEDATDAGSPLTAAVAAPVEAPAIVDMPAPSPLEGQAVTKDDDGAGVVPDQQAPLAAALAPTPTEAQAPLPGVVAVESAEPVAAAAPSDTDGGATSASPQVEPGGPIQTGWQAPRHTLDARAQAAAMADVQPREAAPPATSAVPNGSPAVAAPKPELDATVLAQPSPRAESTPRQEPAPPPNAANLQAPIAAPVAADSRAGAEWTGDDGERQDAPGSRGGAAAGAAPTSERASASFVVPQPTTPAFTSTDGVVPEGSGASVMGRSGELDQAGVENQLVQSMRTLWRGGVSEARVTLRPEYLGAVTISLRLESGGLHAHLRVEDPQVGAWVQANEASLKHALAGQGLTLERLVVSDDSGARDQQAQQGERDRRGARRQAPGNADAARFTINV